MTRTPPRVLMTNETRVADKRTLENFLAHLIDQLDACGFLRNLPKRPGMVRNLRHFFQRGEATEQELRTLHGVVTELAIGRRQRGRLEPEEDRPSDQQMDGSPSLPADKAFLARLLPDRLTGAPKTSGVTQFQQIDGVRQGWPGVLAAKICAYCRQDVRHSPTAKGQQRANGRQWSEHESLS